MSLGGLEAQPDRTSLEAHSPCRRCVACCCQGQDADKQRGELQRQLEAAQQAAEGDGDDAVGGAGVRGAEVAQVQSRALGDTGLEGVEGVVLDDFGLVLGAVYRYADQLDLDVGAGYEVRGRHVLAGYDRQRQVGRVQTVKLLIPGVETSESAEKKSLIL